MTPDVFDTLARSRRSIRRFLPTAVPQPTVEAILAAASQAPSGSNTQPWQVIAVAGHARERLTAALLNAAEEPAAHTEEYAYYPRQWQEPYLARRRQLGFALYGLLGIGKGDKERMKEQFDRNYRFFDAPVGLIFTIDRIMEQGSWLDYGMFLQTVMLAARAHGLDTCPQAAFCQYHDVIERELQLPPERMVVCGMSLGFADHAAPENALLPPREPVAGFARFAGFSE